MYLVKRVDPGLISTYNLTRRTGIHGTVGAVTDKYVLWLPANPEFNPPAQACAFHFGSHRGGECTKCVQCRTRTRLRRAILMQGAVSRFYVRSSRPVKGPKDLRDVGDAPLASCHTCGIHPATAQNPVHYGGSIRQPQCGDNYHSRPRGRDVDA